MKPLKRKLASSLTLFILLSTTQLASAFYDPSLGRWINRDPVEEIAFQNQTRRHRSADYFRGNLYWCMVNNPINKLDSWGLQIRFDSGCGEQEIQDIRDALSDSCDRARNCAGCNEGAGGVNNLCSDEPDITIFCRDENWISPISNESCSGNCGVGSIGAPFINLCPSSWDPQACGPIGCTLFHEAMHTGGEPHGPGMSNFDRCMGCE